MTFRIDESIMNKLRNESEQREVSLNTLVNQILKRYVEWDLYEPKVGMIPLAKPIVVEMFQKMNEDEIVDIARRIGKNAVKDIALFMKGKIDVNSFLSWFESRMKTSSVELNHMIENDSHTYIMKHDLGENWSFYHKNLLELIFNEILGKSIDINISNTTVMFTFKE
jgi:hypothetical protein